MPIAIRSDAHRVADHIIDMHPLTREAVRRIVPADALIGPGSIDEATQVRHLTRLASRLRVELPPTAEQSQRNTQLDAMLEDILALAEQEVSGERDAAPRQSEISAIADDGEGAKIRSHSEPIKVVEDAEIRSGFTSGCIVEDWRETAENRAVNREKNEGVEWRGEPSVDRTAYSKDSIERDRKSRSTTLRRSHAVSSCKPSPKLSADVHTSPDRVLTFIQGFEASLLIDKPLNQIVTFNVQGCQGTGPDIIKAITAAILPFDPFPALAGMYENDAKGGRGLHCHMMLHLPPEKYIAATAEIEEVLAKRCRTSMRVLAQRNGVSIKTRDKALAIFRKLQSVCPKALPFHIQSCAPIGEHEMRDHWLRYLSKSIDPWYPVKLSDGSSRPIESFFVSDRDYNLPIGDELYGHEGKQFRQLWLQPQASKRPANPLYVSKPVADAIRAARFPADQDMIADTLISFRAIDAKWRRFVANHFTATEGTNSAYLKPSIVTAINASNDLRAIS